MSTAAANLRANPSGGQSILKRQPRIRIGGYVQHRKIIIDERVGQTAEGYCHKNKLRLSRGPGEGD